MTARHWSGVTIASQSPGTPSAISPALVARLSIGPRVRADHGRPWGVLAPAAVISLAIV